MNFPSTYCVINYASILGISPFQYDIQKNRIKLATSQFILIRWRLSFAIGVFLRIMVVGRCILDYSTNLMSDIADTKTVFRLFVVGILLFSGCFNFHTVWRIHEIEAAMNAPRELFKRLQGNCFWNTEPFKLPTLLMP